MKEMIGMVLGWAIIVVLAWLAAFALMAYSLDSILPWTWTVDQRVVHLMLQGFFVGAFAYWKYPSERR